MDGFHLRKTLQAIASVLHFHGTREMSYLRILKLLYIADRESIRETGQPITGDRIVAMKHGPVLSGTYNLIKGEHTDWPVWSEYFRRVHYRLEMIKDPGNGTLSKYEIRKLQELVTRFEDKNEWELVELTHTFPEWQKYAPGDSSRPISLLDILEATGRSAEKDAIAQEAHDLAAFDDFFARATG